MIADRTRSEKRDVEVLGVIPARLASTRLPRKVLRRIAGKPMLGWVYDAAVACDALDDVVIAVDSAEVEDLCGAHGWPCRMTSPDLPSGTDRLCAVAEQISASIYVNIQGDEPLLAPEHVHALLRPFRLPHVDVTTLKLPCPPEDVANPNAVKVVTAADGRALYFSRSTIPFDRDRRGAAVYWKHMGLYAFRREALLRFPALPYSGLEASERLEQLRLLESGMAIYVERTDVETVGVDTEEDLRRVETILLRRTSDGATQGRS